MAEPIPSNSVPALVPVYTPAYGNAQVNTLQNKHVELKNVEKIYQRIAILQTEDEEKYADPEFFVPLPNERASAVNRRKKQFKMGFINPTHDLITAKGDMIFKKSVIRKTDNEIALSFIEGADKSGRSLDEIMHNEVSSSLAAFGTVFAVVDKPNTEYISLAEEQNNGTPYMYLIDPLSVMDFEWNEEGELLWFRYKADKCVPRINPFDSKPNVIKGYVTWTQNHYLFHNEKGTKLDEIQHGFGVCPVVIQSLTLDPNTTIGRSTFFTSSQYIVNANNMISIANNEIGKAASAILLLSVRDLNETSIDRDDNVEDGGVSMTTKTADTEDIMAIVDIKDAKPEYLLKNLDVVGLAQTSADKYFDLACDNEKSTVDVKNLNPQSGVSKGYDFQEIDAMLANHAECLESFEKQLAAIIGAQQGTNESAYLVQYPRTFDVRSFSDKMTQLKDLLAIGYPSATAILTSQQALIPDITRDPDTMELINTELLEETAEKIAEDVLEDKAEIADPAESESDLKPEVEIE